MKKVPVLEFTHVYRYYGDDCIGFAAARGNYFACGDREPILLDVPGYPALHNLSFEPDGAKTRPLVPEAGPALVFPAAMLKAQAMRRKPQSQYDFTTIDANGRIVGRTGGGP